MVDDIIIDRLFHFLLIASYTNGLLLLNKIHAKYRPGERIKAEGLRARAPALRSSAACARSLTIYRISFPSHHPDKEGAIFIEARPPKAADRSAGPGHTGRSARDQGDDHN